MENVVLALAIVAALSAPNAPDQTAHTREGLPARVFGAANIGFVRAPGNGPERIPKPVLAPSDEDEGPPVQPVRGDVSSTIDQDVKALRAMYARSQQKPDGSPGISPAEARGHYERLYRKLYQERQSLIDEAYKAEPGAVRTAYLNSAIKLSFPLDEIKPPGKSDDLRYIQKAGDDHLDILEMESKKHWRNLPSGKDNLFRKFDPLDQTKLQLQVLDEAFKTEVDTANKALRDKNFQAATRSKERLRRLKAVSDELRNRTRAVQTDFFKSGVYDPSTAEIYNEYYDAKLKRIDEFDKFQEDFGKAYDRIFAEDKERLFNRKPPELAPDDGDPAVGANAGADTLNTMSIANADEAALQGKFGWLLGTWETYSPWGDRSNPTGGTVIFSAGADGTVTGRIGRLNSYMEDKGYKPGMIVFRGFSEVLSFGPDGTDRFETRDGEFYQIDRDGASWRADSIGVRQDGELHLTPPAVSRMSGHGPLRKQGGGELTM
ncbi:MAG: hypothetical protein KDD90_05330 [Sphingomonadaceae bacterium]|nr:hypothetical protein [Sphingomonadaceae bacterium]